MELIDEYLDEVCKFIKNEKACFEIRKELRMHIDENVEMYMQKGDSRKISINKALKALGSSEKLGRDLNEVHKERIDFNLIIIVVFLGIVGFIGTFSFNNFIANSMDGEGLNIFSIKQIIWMLLGVIFFFVGYKIKIDYIKKLYFIVYILGYVLLLFSRTGRQNVWSFIGPIDIPVLVVVPVCFLFSIASIYEKFSIETNKRKIILLILEIVPLFFIVYKTEYIPLYLCYSIPLLIVIYINSKSIKNLIIPFLLEIIFFIEIGIKEIFMRTSNSSLVANILESSKIIGKNPHMNPFVNLNFPIVSVIGNYGILSGIIIMLGLLYLSFRIIKSSSKIKNSYYKSLAFVIGAIIVIEIILSILVNLNLLNIQITTVLISYGGFSFIITLFLLGIFNNVYRYKNISVIK